MFRTTQSALGEGTPTTEGSSFFILTFCLKIEIEILLFSPPFLFRRGSMLEHRDKINSS